MEELYQEAYQVRRSIRAYGEGFMQSLLGAMEMADSENLAKICDTWRDEWDKYLDMAKKMED